MQEYDEDMKNNPDAEKTEGQNALTQPKDVFISYSSLEAEKAIHIRDILEANGISCWMAPDSIPAGSSYLDEINDAISGCKVLIVLLSEKAQNSEWVISEVEIARDERKYIIPYKIEDCKLSSAFRVLIKTKQHVEGFGDEKKAIQQVMDSIRTVLNQPIEPEITYTRTSGPAGSKGKWIAAAVILALVILGGAWWYVSNRSSGTEDSAAAAAGAPATENTAAELSAARVYYSEALPYTKAGFYQSYDSRPAEVRTDIQVSEAFSILSFVRNFGDRDAVIEKISCEIEQLTPTEVPVIHINGFIQDNILKLFLMNDGWGDASGVEIRCSVSPSGEVPAFSSIEQALSPVKTADAAAGTIVYAAEFAFDPSEVQEWAEKNKITTPTQLGLVNVVYTYEEEESEAQYQLYYYPDSKSLGLDEGGAGGMGDGGSITLFGLLDVDQNPSAITFSGQDAYPIVHDTFRIETVIVPTKSCLVRCKGVYSVNGERQETDTYNISVSVPRFYPGSFSRLSSKLIQEIAQADATDAAALEKIAGQYRYDAKEYVQFLKDDAQN